MHAIFTVGTAGSGKSLLTAVLRSWYEEKGAHVATVNLDPGGSSLPYSPEVDIRERIDLKSIMDQYQLGPNGAMILASDLVASSLLEIQEELDSLNPDYALLDTPGQMELFAYRSSGPYIAEKLRSEGKVVLFLFDPALVSNSLNFVSISLLAASVQLRLGLPMISVLSKIDLAEESWRRVLAWSTDLLRLEDSIDRDAKEAQGLLSRRIVRELARLGYGPGMLPMSSVTREGLVNLSAAISRVLKRGEE